MATTTSTTTPTTPAFTWQIPTLDRDTATGCVTTVHWRIVATDGVNVRDRIGTFNVPFKDPTDPTFVAFDSLTQAEVLTWIAAHVDQAAYEKSLAEELAAVANPPISTGLPTGW